ncbi:uncharacterized protein B0P05DRAFT_554211 [Gilbertella persicaria]|uniref:Uncharacterized protein n=1 Tax=Rhizopus stolonifer TaxID=4846 RepID=A0A367KFB8_RHIST|nr:uncharacterized protein B0P05DRAFT_554211 [Gilbertella persicaria]KAI8065405.1 hypothetical protein B0P05DRAFT_554211 [Gilbertella persicaria]RCI00522.1 hypothetical protein CU098_005502 [Rhizopus stolonifer]
MSTLIIDADHNDDLLHINKVEDYQLSFDMDDLFSPSTAIDCRRLSSSSNEEFDIKAPPPSPQAQPMLDMLFSQKLNASLERLVEKTMNPLEHAQTLDRLLRKTLKNEKTGIGKKHKRSTSLSISDNRKSWQAKAANQRLKNIAKATEHSEKLKTHCLTEEETAVMINELREMGL